MTAIGERVLAVRSADETTLFIYGYGTYVGYETPPVGTPHIFGPITQELVDIGYTNPKIELDSGDVVWGAQCWWGPVDKMLDEYAIDREIEVVPVPEGE